MDCCFQQSASSTGNISNSREARLLVQFLCAYLIYVATWSWWLWLPYLPFAEWVGFMTSTFYYLNNVANPTVYLIFNKSLRQKVFHLFCRKTNEASVVFVSMRTAEERKVVFYDKANSTQPPTL
ncbi:unnamed protein product [Cylicocyclus nassatus]|uniref:G-protein coupled receptors family 1 profile domain-containing protein n=1 Tax=Cylicocyclus nassatus TaxID=53992 RepID=A0AA36GSK6_CYLNA|nr:unnamed protein product [Cylicocyclus nassatus]